MHCLCLPVQVTYKKCNIVLSDTYVLINSIGHVNNISTNSRNTQSKSCTLSLTECVWEFRNNALWNTHKHALLDWVYDLKERSC